MLWGHRDESDWAVVRCPQTDGETDEHTDGDTDDGTVWPQ